MLIELHTLENTTRGAREQWTLDTIADLAEMRAANAGDEHTLGILEMLEAGVDEVIAGGGAATTTRLRPFVVTDDDLAELELEAGAAGDLEQAALCRRARGELFDEEGLLDGGQWERVVSMKPDAARRACEEAIAEARVAAASH